MKVTALIKDCTRVTGVNDDTKFLTEFIKNNIIEDHNLTLNDIEVEHAHYKLTQMKYEEIEQWGLSHKYYLDKILSKPKLKSKVKTFRSLIVHSYLEFQNDYFLGWLFDNANLYHNILLQTVYECLENKGIEEITLKQQIDIEIVCWKFSKKKNISYTVLFDSIDELIVKGK